MTKTTSAYVFTDGTSAQKVTLWRTWDEKMEKPCLRVFIDSFLV
jgi:hypothetical protein